MITEEDEDVCLSISSEEEGAAAEGAAGAQDGGEYGASANGVTPPPGTPKGASLSPAHPPTPFHHSQSMHPDYEVPAGTCQVAYIESGRNSSNCTVSFALTLDVRQCKLLHSL